METNLGKIFKFFIQIGKLKTTYRYSTSKKIHHDSSADHTWRVAMMTFMINQELKLAIDIGRAVKIALVHDLAEAITGDIDVILIKNNTITKEEKNRLEERAMMKMKNDLPPELGDEIYNLWLEYEKGETKEARYVKAMDKIETTIHLISEGHEKFDDLDLIATYADKCVKSCPELKNFLRVVKEKLKEEFTKGNIEWKQEYDQ